MLLLMEAIQLNALKPGKNILSTTKPIKACEP
jgi:hypothetical protein